MTGTYQELKSELALKFGSDFVKRHRKALRKKIKNRRYYLKRTSSFKKPDKKYTKRVRIQMPEKESDSDSDAWQD